MEQNNKTNKRMVENKEPKQPFIRFLKQKWALTFAIMLIVCVAGVGVAITLAGEQNIRLAAGDTLLADCEGRGVRIERSARNEVTIFCKPTRTTEPAPTAEPAPTTAPPAPVEPAPTTEPVNPEPQPTALPPGTGPIAPFAEAPACDEIGASHDGTAYHGLWNAEYGCHYDHEHGAPYPDWAQGLFGDYTTLTGSQISYPWQTPGENDMKHPGYNMHGFDMRAYGCYELNGNGGIWAWWIQAHAMSLEMGVTARYHSFYGMAALCRNNAPAGIIKIGGHVDYGQLVSPYKGGQEAIVGAPAYAKAPQVYQNDLPPYVGLAETTGSFETWNSVTRTTTEPYLDRANELFNFAFRIRDARLTYDHTTGQFVTFDEPGHNSSLRQFYQVELTIPAELADENGRVNFTGWVNTQGQISDTCTAAGPDCAPLVIIDAVPGDYSVNLRSYQDAFGGSFNPRNDGYFEGDIYFDGKPSGWIGPMN